MAARVSMAGASILAPDDPMRRNPYLRQNRIAFLVNFRHFRILEEMTKVDIQKLALALPEADQIELAHTLLDNTTPSLTEAQEIEVTRRIKAYRDDPSILVSEEDALIRLKQLVAG